MGTVLGLVVGAGAPLRSRVLLWRGIQQSIWSPKHSLWFIPAPAGRGTGFVPFFPAPSRFDVCPLSRCSTTAGSACTMSGMEVSYRVGAVRWRGLSGLVPVFRLWALAPRSCFGVFSPCFCVRDDCPHGLLRPAAVFAFEVVQLFDGRGFSDEFFASVRGILLRQRESGLGGPELVPGSFQFHLLQLSSSVGVRRALGHALNCWCELGQVFFDDAPHDFLIDVHIAVHHRVAES